MIDEPTLQDGTVVLRPWQPEDAPQLESVCGADGVSAFTSVPWVYSAEAARDWVARQRAHAREGTGVVLAVTRPGENLALGMVTLSRFSEDRRKAALGYWLIPAARGHGLSVPAARLLAEWGFSQLGLARIELAIKPGNDASQRVAERLGAVNEGFHPGHAAGGRILDAVVYSLTPTG